MDVSKNRGYLKMDGLFHGKPYEQMDDLGVKTPIFGLTPIYSKTNIFSLKHPGVSYKRF